MGEKRRGFWNRLLPPDGRGEDPSPEVVTRWLAEDDGKAVPAHDEGDDVDDGDEEDDPPGVLIMELPPGSPLLAAGLRVGDLIAAVDGVSTPTEAELAAALGPLSPGEPATLTVLRGGWELTIEILSPG